MGKPSAGRCPFNFNTAPAGVPALIPAFPNSCLHLSPGLVTDLSPGSNTTLLSTAAKLNLRSLALEAPQSSSNSHDLCSSLSRPLPIPPEDLLQPTCLPLIHEQTLLMPPPPGRVPPFPSLPRRLPGSPTPGMHYTPCLLLYLHAPVFFTHRVPKLLVGRANITFIFFFCFKSQLISVCEMKGELNQGY